MNPQNIQRHLGQPLPMRCFASLDSTNAYAKRWAAAGAPHGATVFADAQTQGRGRRGHSFFSPEGGLYMSLIVDSGELSPGMFTTLAAVAALEAVREEAGQVLQIKWVNDLFYEGLKMGGILTEGVVADGVLSRAVIGIGLNLGPAAMPEDLARIAGTLYAPGRKIDRERLAALIIRGILKGLPGAPGHLAAYRAHCLTLGRQVYFEYENQPRTGLAIDIDDAGALLVKTSGGLIRLIAGDVSVRPG